MPDLRRNQAGYESPTMYTFIPATSLQLNTDGTANGDGLVLGSLNGIPFAEFDPGAGTALAANDGFGFALVVPYQYPADTGGNFTVRPFVGITGGGGPETGSFQLLLENNANDAATADPNDFTIAADQGAVAFDADNSLHEITFQVPYIDLSPGRLLGCELSVSAVTGMGADTEELRVFGGIEVIWRPLGVYLV